MEELALTFQETGDLEVFSALVSEIRPLAYNKIFSILKNEQDAEEAYNDFLTTLYFKIDSFRWESKFSSWVYTLVFNCAVMALRKRKKKEITVSEEAWVMLESNLIQESDTIPPRNTLLEDEKIKKALEKCNDRSKNLLEGFYLENKSLIQLSEELDISYSLAKVATMRAREEFKKHYTRIN